MNYLASSPDGEIKSWNVLVTRLLYTGCMGLLNHSRGSSNPLAPHIQEKCCIHIMVVCYIACMASSQYYVTTYQFQEICISLFWNVCSCHWLYALHDFINLLYIVGRSSQIQYLVGQFQSLVRLIFLSSGSFSSRLSWVSPLCCVSLISLSQATLRSGVSNANRSLPWSKILLLLHVHAAAGCEARWALSLTLHLTNRASLCWARWVLSATWRLQSHCFLHLSLSLFLSCMGQSHFHGSCNPIYIYIYIYITIKKKTDWLFLPQSC